MNTRGRELGHHMNKQGAQRPARRSLSVEMFVPLFF